MKNIVINSREEGAPKPKYQIRLNPPAPTAQEIVQQQNFGKVLRQYKSQQKLKPYHALPEVLKRLFPLLVAAGLLFLLLTYYGKWAKSEQQSPPEKQEDRR